VNGLDVFIVVLAVGGAVGGYRLGLVARAASWVGLALGVVLAARSIPTVTRWLRDASDVQLLVVAAGLLLGGAFLGQGLGLLIGARLHHGLPRGGARQVDRAGGAVAGVLGVAVLVWFLVPVMARVPGWPAQQARTSAIAPGVISAFPEVPAVVRTMQALVGNRLPAVFDAFEPAPDLGPVPAAAGISQAVVDSVVGSTVLVETSACGRIQNGSGSVIDSAVGPVVVTNAHVVAGADEVTVQPSGGGGPAGATIVAFDPARDLAVLAAPELDRPPLAVGASVEGTVGAVFGHPGGGPLELSPFAIGGEVVATGRDIYGGARTEREVLFLSSQLRPGDSGGALIDAAGTVVGVAFAIAPDDPNVAYALTTDELAAILATDLATQDDSGPCIR
jgi:S1-C subfamily serine protease